MAHRVELVFDFVSPNAYLVHRAIPAAEAGGAVRFFLAMGERVGRQQRGPGAQCSRPDAPASVASTKVRYCRSPEAPCRPPDRGPVTAV